MNDRYLTKADVPYDVAARWQKGRGFADPYAWHQRVWECFPNRDGVSRDFLTRVDAKDDGFQLLILSQIPPQRPDWCPTENWRSKQIGDDFLLAARYRFSLLANPTRKVRLTNNGEARKNGRRVPITHREDRESADGKPQRGLLSWLAHKGEQHGFRCDLEKVRTIPRPRQFFIKAGDRAGVHTATEFQGVLEVIDRAAFTEAFMRGIGSAKAFGFGMLCLAPLK